MTGFSSLPDVDRQRVGRFWLDVLEPYTPAEVRKAFLTFARSDTGYPNPQRIASIIVSERKAKAQRAAQKKRDAQLLADRAATETLTEDDLQEKREKAREIVGNFLKHTSQRKENSNA